MFKLATSGGLAGLSGIAGGDVRDLEAAGTDAARLALDVFAYGVRKTIGAYAAVMGGVDLVAFTGGIGENSASLRESCWTRRATARKRATAWYRAMRPLSPC